jgi:hypothetical protein
MEYNQEFNKAHWPGCSGKDRFIQAGVVNVCKPVEERKLSLIKFQLGIRAAKY